MQFQHISNSENLNLDLSRESKNSKLVKIKHPKLLEFGFWKELFTFVSLYSSGLRETRVRVELQCLQENGTLALVNDDDIPTGKLMWSSQATDITFWFISF